MRNDHRVVDLIISLTAIPVLAYFALRLRFSCALLTAQRPICHESAPDFGLKFVKIRVICGKSHQLHLIEAVPTVHFA